MASSRVAVYAGRCLLLAALLVAWEVIGRTKGGVFFPSFTATAGELVEIAKNGQLWEAAGSSNESLAIGFPASVLLGVPVGLLFGRSKGVDRSLSYYLDIMLVVPMVALVPLVIVALGLSLTARVAIVMLFAFPVIALNARAGVRVIDRNRVEMARSFGASRLQVWTKIILPAAIAPISSGIRLGLARAVSGMIVVELILIPVGLGGLMVTFESEFAAASLYAVTLAVIIEGVALATLAKVAENAIVRRMSGV